MIIKKLTRQGNSAALIIDRTLMDLLDIDQETPLEVDDEYITENEIGEQPEGIISMMAAPNAHTRLLKIMANVVKAIYPMKQGSCIYTVSFATIRELENELQEWICSLPGEPGKDSKTLPQYRK